ncbi:N-acetyl-alpha-D-glucosaminyl L-malate synthase BshA [Coraliomargarita sp. SDUM461004]|uniref:N-acetyl-alpha-D-glucosaminyl L-malate synthase BshA n=1 Tax=Thalassobacterium sedimentorum TaxID=3041258 RepID=A0ABU1AH80_9BACT|nr:N-acetyl-alpha-D-glucosaminyl L-malate synthase BshA [Coraliomargarita sp. SDUM461004]MDQ8194171.1 N-acetyl-alpha-D-glucosaminyl L-malate synthase BshA [Coraliomargarita sp. SDUM461004]
MESRLKIGMVCYPSIGGSGIVATELGMLLAAAGHEIHFISYERPVRLKCGENLFYHPVVVNEYSLFKYPDYTLPLSVRIMEVCAEHQLDVLHVHYAVPHATGALLAKQMLGPDKKCPVILTTLHGTDTNLLGKDPHYRPIIKYSIENSDGVSTVSESLKVQTIETFGIQHSIKVIPNFYAPATVKPSREEVRQELQVTEAEHLLLHMSNARPGKRVIDVLKAVARLNNRSRVKLLILAGGDFEPYEAEVMRLDLQDRVIVIKDVKDIEPYLNACDLGLYASEAESFGLSILETLAHGKPVVATDVGGIPEVVQDGRTGLLVPPHSPEALADAIDQLIDHPEQMTAMGQAAAEDAKARFAPPVIRDQYLRCYRDLLASL